MPSPRKKGPLMTNSVNEDGLERLKAAVHNLKTGTRGRAAVRVPKGVPEQILARGVENRPRESMMSPVRRRPRDEMVSPVRRRPKSRPPSPVRPVAPDEAEESASAEVPEAQESDMKETNHEEGIVRANQNAQGVDLAITNKPGPNIAQSVVDIVMWKEVARSILYFGAGCFFILGATFTSEVQTSLLSLVSYSLLFYLSITFVRQTFFGRVAKTQGFEGELTEEHVLQALRFLMPALRASKHLHARIFCGHSTTTLQVAIGLWLIAQLSSLVTFWTFLRVAFFAAFSLPRVYLLYGHHVHAKGSKLLARCQHLWAGVPHKRLVAGVSAYLVFKTLGAPTKLFLCFLALVLFQRFRESHSPEVAAGVEYVRKRARRMSLGVAPLEAAVATSRDPTAVQMSPVKYYR